MATCSQISSCSLGFGECAAIIQYLWYYPYFHKNKYEKILFQIKPLQPRLILNKKIHLCPSKSAILISSIFIQSMEPTDCCIVDDNVLPLMTALGHLLMAFPITFTNRVAFINHVAMVQIPKLDSWTLLWLQCAQMTSVVTTFQSNLAPLECIGMGTWLHDSIISKKHRQVKSSYRIPSAVKLLARSLDWIQTTPPIPQNLINLLIDINMLYEMALNVYLSCTSLMGIILFSLSPITGAECPHSCSDLQKVTWKWKCYVLYVKFYVHFWTCWCIGDTHWFC